MEKCEANAAHSFQLNLPKRLETIQLAVRRWQGSQTERSRVERNSNYHIFRKTKRKMSGYMNFSFPAGYESDPSDDDEDMGRWEKKVNGAKVTERAAEVSSLLCTISL